MNRPEFIEIHWHRSDSYWTGKVITQRLLEQRLEDELVSKYAGKFLQISETVLRDGDHITVLVEIV